MALKVAEKTIGMARTMERHLGSPRFVEDRIAFGDGSHFSPTDRRMMQVQGNGFMSIVPHEKGLRVIVSLPADLAKEAASAPPSIVTLAVELRRNFNAAPDAASGLYKHDYLLPRGQAEGYFGTVDANTVMKKLVELLGKK